MDEHYLDSIAWRMPDLQLESASGLRSSLWLADEGQEVIAGGRLLEVLAGDMAVTLEAPFAGRLLRRLIDEDAPLRPGQKLAILAPIPPAE